jgi:transcriptional regulator with XRE-family HTH domain
MGEAFQRRLLGEFVRERRERMQPEGPAGRRRTPGLRREELAALAGISPVWCAWIEQGRNIQASPRALGRLAVALGLSDEDRAALFALAGRPDPTAVAPVGAASIVPDSLRAVVEGFDQPAYALDRMSNASCWNAGAASLLPGWLGEGRQRNLLRYVFLDRSARILAPAWQEWARCALSEFRLDNEDAPDEPAAIDLLDTLRRESLFFSKAWDAGPPAIQSEQQRTFFQPDGASKSFREHSFKLANASVCRMVTLTPVA